MSKYKRCAYSLCQNNGQNTGDDVFFVAFPRPSKDLKKCERWVAACERYDLDLLSRIEKHTLYICSKHFDGGNGPTAENPDPLPFTETDDTVKLMGENFIKRIEADGGTISKDSFPTHDLSPITSCEVTQPINVDEEILPIEEDKDIFQNEPQTKTTFTQTQIQDVYMEEVFNFEKLKGMFTSSQIILPNTWHYTVSKNNLVIFKSNVETSSIIFSLSVSKDSLIPVVTVYGQHLTNNRMLTQLPEFNGIEAIYAAVDIFKHWSLCRGIKEDKFKTQFEAREFNQTEGHVSFFTKQLHSKKCEIILEKSKRRKLVCGKCSVLKVKLQKQLKRKLESKVKEKRNVYLSRGDLQLKIKMLNRKNENLARKLKRLRRKFLGELKKHGQDMEEADTDYLRVILRKNKHSLRKDSFANLFVEQQLAALKAKKKCNRRWHPKIIQWCLYLKQKSTAAYDILQSSGAFQLPSKRTLYNYASHLGSTPGYNPDSFKELRELTESSCKEDHQKYFCLMFDEMKIKEDIVYKTNTGELVGYINLNDIGNEIEEMKIAKNEAHVATHILQVMVRAITGKVKYTVGYFPSDNMSSDSLHSIISEAVSKLEMNGVKILCVVSDGASTNRKVMKQFVGENGYKCKNTYAMDEERDLYFICDPPHLIKTTRNCFSNSNYHAKTRYLWKNGHHILWSQIVALYDRDFNRTIKLLPKITADHIRLNSLLRMRVRLATQILSSTVANALEEEYGNGYPETVKFIRLMDRFFDLMISRNLNEGVYKRNRNLDPYKSIDDPRLQWLEKDFVQYFLDWENEVANRPGNFTSTQRNMMKLSRETVEGLITTARSVPKVVRFLLLKGAKFVLTNHLNQDCLEQEFGKQRRSFGNNEAPNAFQFGHGLDKIKKLDFLIKAPETGSTLVSKLE